MSCTTYDLNLRITTYTLRAFYRKLCHTLMPRYLFIDCPTDVPRPVRLKRGTTTSTDKSLYAMASCDVKLHVMRH